MNNLFFERDDAKAKKFNQERVDDAKKFNQERIDDAKKYNQERVGK